MSDIFLVKDGENRVRLLRTYAEDKGPGSRKAGLGTGDKKGRSIEDVIDLGAHRSFADKIRGEKDPEKIKSTLAEGQRGISAMVDKFRSLFFGRSFRSAQDSFFSRLRSAVLDIMQGPHPGKAKADTAPAASSDGANKTKT